jgi:AraC-like DNA-binding protein
MQIQLFRKSVQKPLRAKKEIPAAYSSLQLPHALNTYLPLGNGGMLRRNINASGFDLNILDCWADESISLDVCADDSFLTVIHVITGSLTFQLRNSEIIRLKPGCSYLTYLPPGSRNELRIEEGEHRLLSYGVRPELLRETGRKIPSISILLDKIKGRSKVPHCTGEVLMPAGPAQFVRLLESGFESTRDLVTLLYNRSCELLCEQLLKIAQGNIDGGASPIPGWIDRLADARKIVDEQTGPPLRIATVARKCRMNDRQLKLGFRIRYGLPFAQYQIEVRLERARRWLLETEDPVQTIGLMIGYEDESSFTKRFKRTHGLTPLQYRRKYRP